jgi:hypothetical protein
MPGPEAFPDYLLPFPVIKVHDAGFGGMARRLTVLGPDGSPFPNALVALYTTPYSYTIAIDQGLTDQEGQLTIYGALEGDTIQAASFDGACAGAVRVGADTVYTLTLSATGSRALAAQPGGLAPYLNLVPGNQRSTVQAAFSGAYAGAMTVPSNTNVFGALASQDDASSPYLNLIPGSEGDTLLLKVYGAAAGSLPLNAVVIPGEEGGSPQMTSLAYSPAEGAYVGHVSLGGVGLGSGAVRVGGLAGGQWVSINSDYNLLRVLDGQTNDLTSEDGNFQLHVDAGSLIHHADAYAVVLPTGYVPGPLPQGMRVVGSAYEVRFSGAATSLTKPGVLTMHYHPEVMGAVTNLAIHHWDAVDSEWEYAGDEWIELNNSVAVTVEQFGIYVLANLAPYFTLDAQPGSQSLIQGQSAVYTVTLSAYQGFTKSVGLSVSGLPSGVNAIFGSAPLTPPASTSMTISTTTSTPAGDYVLQVQATSGGISRAQSVTLKVQPLSAPSPSFTLDVQPESHSLVQGQSAVYTVTLDTDTGFADPVDLSVVSGLPAGASAVFGNATLTPATSTPLTLTTTMSTPADDYVLEVRATSGGISRTQSATLTVQPYSARIYLPLILRCWPPTPDAPALNSIDHPDQGHNCTVNRQIAAQSPARCEGQRRLNGR